MTQGNADLTLNDRPVFSAELHPYRSLGRNGHRIFFVIAGALSFAHMAVFLLSGAWPIVLFFGVDFLILFGAFWLNNRAAKAREIVSLSRTNISIRKISPSGRETEHVFNPFWARFLVSRVSFLACALDLVQCSAGDGHTAARPDRSLYHT